MSKSKECMMKKVSQLFIDETSLNKRDKYFVADLNKDIANLNCLIMDYNDAKTTEKLTKIDAIATFHLAVIRKYPPDFGSRCPPFRKAFQVDLHVAIKEQ